MPDYDKIPILRTSHRLGIEHYQVDLGNELSREFPRFIGSSAIDVLRSLEPDGSKNKLEIVGSPQPGTLKRSRKNHSPRIVDDVLAGPSYDSEASGSEIECGSFPKPQTEGLFDTDVSTLVAGSSSANTEALRPIIEAACHPHYATTIRHAAQITIAACAARGQPAANANAGNGVSSDVVAGEDIRNAGPLSDMRDWTEDGLPELAELPDFSEIFACLND